MAVRFLPPPGEDAGASAPERADLAEVIDLRSRLGRSAAPDSASAGAPDDTAGTTGTADRVDTVAALRAAAEALRGAEVETAADTESVRTATEDGVRLLARKAWSSGELRRELGRLGHDAQEIEAAVLGFEGSLYLDDLGLARVVAERLRERKGASRAQIRAKLRERLLPDGAIEEALSEFDDEQEQELLRTAAADRARRLTGLDRQTAERRLLGFLARRGWSGERAVRVAREALDRSEARGAVRFR